MFKHMFQGLEERWPTELQAVCPLRNALCRVPLVCFHIRLCSHLQNKHKVRAQYFSEPVVFTDEPCIVHWPDGIAMLREAGVTELELGDFDDLSTAQELLLGKLVKEKFGADFYIMDRYPSNIRSSPRFRARWPFFVGLWASPVRLRVVSFTQAFLHDALC
jgi:aspartyl/asparaginyl-tRNA synthetase